MRDVIEKKWHIGNRRDDEGQAAILHGNWDNLQPLKRNLNSNPLGLEELGSKHPIKELKWCMKDPSIIIPGI